MNQIQREQFIKLTEKMVTPKKVASVFQGAEFLRKLPVSMQKKNHGNDLNAVQTKPFGLIFDPAEMNKALSVNQKDIVILKNDFLKDCISKEPFQVCCFPYAQHFYTTSFPVENQVRSVEDLEKRIQEILELDNKAKHKSKRTLSKACPGYCYRYSCKDGCQLNKK
jgi:hypothetical protein